MALLTYSATPAKGSTVTVTLDKAELLALNAVGIDSFWSGGSDGDVVQAIVTLKTFPGNGKITLTFDLSQATPTAPLTLPQYARDVFQISKIVVVDTMGDKIAIPRATLLTEIPTLAQSEVNLSGNTVPPTISSLDPVFVPEIPRIRFDVTGLSDDVSGNVSLTIYQLTQLPVDLAEVEADGTVIASQSAIAVSTSPINISINGPTLASVPEFPTMYYYAVVAQDSGANKEYIAIEWEFIPPAKRLLIVNDYNSSGQYSGTKYYTDNTYRGVTTTYGGAADAVYGLTSFRSVDSNTNQIKVVSALGTPSVSTITVPSMSSLRCIDFSGESPYQTVVGGVSSVSESAISYYEPGSESWSILPIGSGSEVKSLSRATGTDKIFVISEIVDEFTFSHDVLSYDPATSSIEALASARSGFPLSGGSGVVEIDSKIKVCIDESYFITFGREISQDFGSDVFTAFMSVHSQSNGWTPVPVSISIPSGYALVSFSIGFDGNNPFKNAVIEGTTAYVVGTMYNETETLVVPALYTVNMITASAVGVELSVPGTGVYGAAISVAIHNAQLYVTGWSASSTSAPKLTTWLDGTYEDRSGLSNLSPSGNFPRGVFAGTTG